MPLQLQNDKENHLRFLDSARGIAALMVCISHFIDRGYHDSPAEKYLFFLFNGNDAVSFFFVLSGFVLSYKYLVLNKPLDIKKFWVQRVFRIYPAYILTVAINMLLYRRSELSGKGLVDIFVFDKGEFWQEAFLLRFHNNYYFPGWTLTMEMVCSFFMPFFIILAIKDRRVVFYFFIALLITGINLFNSTHFLLGTIISCYFVELKSPSFRTTKWYRYRCILLLASVVLFSIRRIDIVFPLGSGYKSLAEFLSIDFFLYSGLASFVFIAAILISRNSQKFLELKPLVFIGKISYSIYLVHSFAISLLYIYILPLLHIPGKLLFLVTTLAIYAVITILSATLMHRFAELPFIAIGRRITNKMKPSVMVSK